MLQIVGLKRAVIFSFDFEMRWGVYDIYRDDYQGYRENLENSRPAVTGMLKLLTERKLNATWATVGALASDNWQEYFSLAPPNPNYFNKRLIFDKKNAELDPAGILHFAPDLIHEIVKAKGQELASHTFSHAYYREKGITTEDFLNDVKCVEKIFQNKFNIQPKSLVYPRNQVNFVEDLRRTNLQIYRGSELDWFYPKRDNYKNELYKRGLNMLDSINPFANRATIAMKGISYGSLFVRLNLSECLWNVHLKKIKNNLKTLKTGETLHLWWHPHNIGRNYNFGIKRIRDLLDVVSNELIHSDIESKNMSELLEE